MAVFEHLKRDQAARVMQPTLNHSRFTTPQIPGLHENWFCYDPAMKFHKLTDRDLNIYAKLADDGKLDDAQAQAAETVTEDQHAYVADWETASKLRRKLDIWAVYTRGGNWEMRHGSKTGKLLAEGRSCPRTTCQAIAELSTLNRHSAFHLRRQ